MIKREIKIENKQTQRIRHVSSKHVVAKPARKVKSTANTNAILLYSCEHLFRASLASLSKFGSSIASFQGFKSWCILH